MENTINRSAVGTAEQESLRHELCNPDNLSSFSDGTIGNRRDMSNAQKTVEGDLPKTKFASESDQDTLRRELCGNSNNLTAFSDGTVGNRNDLANHQKAVEGDIPKTKFANIPEADTLTKLRNELLSCDPLFTIACDGKVANALHDFSADSKDVVFDIPKPRDY